MTDPRIYLLRMLVFLGITFVIILLLFNELTIAFFGNPVFNGVIITIAIIGAIFIFRQTLKLVPEVKWLSNIQQTNKISRKAKKPVLLATVNVMLSDSSENGSFSALSLRSILDGVGTRLDENREISRYLIGLLVFLGLLGTFWGLLQTIDSVSSVVGGINFVNSEFENTMNQLQNGLDEPLSGMATAFSSSLFGLAGSLILGFLDLQLGQAMGRFFNEVEDWLTAFVNFRDPELKENQNNLQLAQGLSEEGARAMIKLASVIEKSEIDKYKQTEQVIQISSDLKILAEKIEDEQKLREQLVLLNAQLSQFTENLSKENNIQSREITGEIRALTSAIMKLANSNKNI